MGKPLESVAFEPEIGITVVELQVEVTAHIAEESVIGADTAYIIIPGVAAAGLGRDIQELIGGKAGGELMRGI